MVALNPDLNCHILLTQTYHWCIKNVTGYHPGPVAPSAADGGSFIRSIYIMSWQIDTDDGLTVHEFMADKSTVDEMT